MSDVIEIEAPEAVDIEDAPQALITNTPYYVGVPMMDATEARAVVTQIKTRIDIARGELLELHDREGWKALGYKSWEACARAEFGGSAAQMYRLLSAAQIERAIDSPIGEYPESHLREVAKLSTPAQQKQALDQARAKTNGAPTAKAVRAEVQAIAQPDLPVEFAIIQRRFAAVGHELTTHIQGQRHVYSIKRPGMTGTATFRWDDVLSKLERIEAQAAPPDPAHVEALEEQVESGDRIPEARMVTEPDHGASDNAAAYAQKEARDAGRLLRARTLIGNGEIDAARVVLDGIEVATWSREKLLAEIPSSRQITLAFTDAECAALRKEARAFEKIGLTTKLPTIGQALALLIAGMRGGGND